MTVIQFSGRRELPKWLLVQHSLGAMIIEGKKPMP